MLMYYVYLLKNKRINRLYIGYTENLRRQLDEYKKNDNSIELVYYEAYMHEKQACERERKLKIYGSAWRGLKKRLGI